MNWVKFNSLVEALTKETHNWGTDQLKIALTNVAPASGWTRLSDVTEISYTNLSSRDVTTVSSSQSSGVFKLILADKVLTASGAVGPFRYVVLYNETAPNDEVICYFDYGSSISLASGDTFTVDMDGTNGVLKME